MKVRVLLLLFVLLVIGATSAEAGCPRYQWAGACSDPSYEWCHDMSCSQHSQEEYFCYNLWCTGDVDPQVGCSSQNYNNYLQCAQQSHQSYTNDEEACYTSFCFEW